MSHFALVAICVVCPVYKNSEVKTITGLTRQNTTGSNTIHNLKAIYRRFVYKQELQVFSVKMGLTV